MNLVIRADGRPGLDLDGGSVRLTEAQRQALAIDRELVVTAGAGAGKTYTLSLRYVALLLELAVRAVEASPRAPRPDIEAVLVLTFTEKAAEEMAQRCYRRLLALAEAVRGPSPTAERLDRDWHGGSRAALAAALDHLVDAFDRARIGTFHGFCAAVLREFPAETGTPPDFEVLDEVDTRELRGRIADDVLHRAYADDPDALGALVGALGGHRQTRDGLVDLLDRRDVLAPILARHAAGEVTLDALLDLFPQTPQQVVTTLQDRLLPLVREARDAFRRPLQPGETAHEALVVPLEQAARVLVDAPDPLAVFGLYRQVLEGLTSGGKKLRSLKHHSFMGTKAAWEGIDAADKTRTRDALIAVEEALSDLDLPSRLAEARGLPTRADREMLAALNTLAGLAVQAIERLEATFAAEGTLDFTGLQQRAVRAVLDHPDLRTRLAGRHRYLMVDEFQDTDEAQWSLVRAIGRPDDRPADRIFVVGDAKQAIYRFRGGDVTVFRKATRELGVEPVVLPDNFRSRDELITWFNHFFAGLMGPPDPARPDHEAAYTPLTTGRTDGDHVARGGTVHLAVHDSEDAATDAALAADGIARLLATRLRERAGPWADLRLADRDAHPAPPIAILLRARTRLALYEDALRRHHIPFIVAKGVGFWARAEVRDLVLILHAVASGDPVSTVGALRTPLLGLSDQDLQDLAEDRWSGPTDRRDRFGTFGAWTLDDLAPERVHRAARLLARWRRLRHRLPASELLREILADTAAAHVHALTDAADQGAGEGQAAANVERLLERVARFDDRGAEGLDEAAHHLLTQVLDEERESEAPITPTRARVVLLTVHASKGLEFPVVVVPECGSMGGGGGDSVMHGRIDGDWHVACRALDPDSALRERVRPGLMGLLALQASAEELAEAQRLLYVAATRARDHLVLVGTQPSANTPDVPRSWSEMLALVHGGDGGALVPGDHGVLQIVDLQDWVALQPPAPAAPPEVPAPTERDAWHLSRIPASPGLEVSPSSLDLFARSPKAWFERHRLGFPQRSRPAEPGGDALDPMVLTLAAARGDVVHSLLEDDLADDPDLAAARWRAHAFSVGATVEQVEAGLPALLDQLARAAADPRVRHRLDAHGLAEVRFRLEHGPLTLTGAIDRLWRDDEAGGWVVLDWKSGRVRDLRASATAYARQLVAYAWAADRILRAQGQVGVVRAELYFTAPGALVGLGPLDPDVFAALEGELAHLAQVAGLHYADVPDAPLPPLPVPLLLDDDDGAPPDQPSLFG